MTRQTTALLTIGPHRIAPWADRSWRVSGTAQLVEGSTPYWLVTPTQPAAHTVATDTLVVEVPHCDSVVASVVMLVASWFGGPDVEEVLVSGHNMTLGEEGVRELAPYWDLADTTMALLASKLSNRVRLAFTVMDEYTLVGDSVVEALRSMGFDVDVFVRGSIATSGQDG